MHFILLVNLPYQYKPDFNQVYDKLFNNTLQSSPFTNFKT